MSNLFLNAVKKEFICLIPAPGHDQKNSVACWNHLIKNYPTYHGHLFKKTDACCGQV